MRTHRQLIVAEFSQVELLAHPDCVAKLGRDRRVAEDIEVKATRTIEPGHKTEGAREAAIPEKQALLRRWPACAPHGREAAAYHGIGEW